MVQYLSWYISNRKLCPKGTQKINIFQEIEKYKSRNPGIKPTIVFDFISTITAFINDSSEILAAGRQNVLNHKAEIFCQKLIEAGVDLVFFIDGPIKDFKFQLWLDRKNKKYLQQQAIFESLRNGETPNLKYTGQMISGYFDNFLIITRKYGKIFVSLRNECDIDLASYATKIRATAVCALDTDFLIMPGDWAIWSPFKFNFKDFTTIKWNKKNLRDQLNLQQNQMPIFSTLSGNDFILPEKIQYLKEKLSFGDVPQVGLAEYIRKTFPRGIFGKELYILSELIYNNGENGYTMEEAKRLVQKSIDFYNYAKHTNPDIEPQWLQKHVNETGSTLIYQMLKGHPLIIHESYIDLSKADVRPFADSVLPIFRRFFGVAYYDIQDENRKCVICFKPSHEELYQKRIFSPIYPPKSVPKLPVLLGYENGEDEYTLEQKFELFAWILSPRRSKLKVSDLISLAETPYLVSILVIYYLLKDMQITIEEADVLLLSINESVKAPPEKLFSISPPEKFQERPFWIAFVFVHLARVISDSLVLSGLFNYVKVKVFDGYIFHKMYLKYLTMQREEKLKILEPVMEYRLYAK